MSESQAVFRRELGTVEAVLLSVGGMVGSAIFVFPGSTGSLAGPASILAWFLAGVLMFGVALCYTELAMAFPKAGGPAIYPYEVIRSRPLVRAFASYLAGVGYSLGWVFAITVSALAIAEYLSIVVPGVGGYTVPVALVAIGLAVVVNVTGITTASWTNVVLSALLLAILLVFVGIGFANAAPRSYWPVLPTGPVRFLGAVQIAITAYGAWTAIPAAIEEIETPRQTVPRAIALSLAITIVLYTSVVAAVHGVVPFVEFAREGPVVAAPLGVAASKLGVPWFRTYVLPIAAIVAIFTTMLVGLLSASRALFALGRNRTIPAVFATTSDRFDVPWVGIAVVASVAGVLAAVPQYFYQLLVIASIVGTGLPYAINILAFVWHRRQGDSLAVQFRAPGGYLLPVVAFLALAVAMAGLGSTEVVWSVGALALLSGLFALRYVTAPAAIRDGQPAITTDAQERRRS